MKKDIILVHTGTKFPNHINDCISFLKKRNFTIHLILSKSLHKNVIHDDIILEEAEFYQNQYFDTFENKSGDSDFLDGFWTRTSSRFFIIAEYAKFKNIESFFHIENDVALFSDLQRESLIFNESQYDMFLAMDRYYRCIPSILWIRNYSILEKLSLFIFSNPNRNDMENLALFFYQNSDLVSNLPIIPNEKIALKDWEIDYQNNFEILNGVFDAAALGQYLFGIDPICSDNNSSGFINETCVFDPSQFEYIKDGSDFYILTESKKIKIFNLHMHCKNFKLL